MVNSTTWKESIFCSHLVQQPSVLVAKGRKNNTNNLISLATLQSKPEIEEAAAKGEKQVLHDNSMETFKTATCIHSLLTGHKHCSF